MKEELTIETVEQMIEECTDMLSMPLSRKAWSRIASQYHALNIKLCMLKGEQPVVIHVKPDYITK